MCPWARLKGISLQGFVTPLGFQLLRVGRCPLNFRNSCKSFGYDKPTSFDKEVTELYLFNPATQSSVQIDLTPADRYTVFSQSLIEHLTNMGASSFREELEEEHGKDVEAQVSPSEPVKLKGVQYAAKRSATYTVKGVERDQGWIYGFTEPYQIFILYQIIDKQGSNDRQDLKTIIDSFEVISKK